MNLNKMLFIRSLLLLIIAQIIELIGFAINFAYFVNNKPENFLSGKNMSDVFTAGQISVNVIRSYNIYLLLYRTAMAVFIEEVFYRYFVMNRLFKGIPAVIAIIAQAIIFTTMHQYYRVRDITDNDYQYICMHYFRMIFWSGIIYGSLTKFSKSIIPSTILHLIHNAAIYYTIRRIR